MQVDEIHGSAFPDVIAETARANPGFVAFYGLRCVRAVAMDPHTGAVGVRHDLVTLDDLVIAVEAP
jgi:hypothetical protein